MLLHVSRSLPIDCMSDAPWKWWNKLDAAVKAMGLCHARADRCTYVSYDKTRSRKAHVTHTISDSKVSQPFDETIQPISEAI